MNLRLIEYKSLTIQKMKVRNSCGDDKSRFDCIIFALVSMVNWLYVIIVKMNRY